MRLGVIGAGAWGTALAQIAATAGQDTLLWAREAEVVSAINETHENALFLPGVALSPAIIATSDLADLQACDALLVVTPAQFLGRVLAEAQPGHRPLILCSKGIEAETQRLMSDVAAATAPRRLLLCCLAPLSHMKWPRVCRLPLHWPAQMKLWANNWRSASPNRIFGPICPPM